MVVGILLSATNKFLKSFRNIHSLQNTSFPKSLSLSNTTELLRARIFEGFLTVTLFLLGAAAGQTSFWKWFFSKYLASNLPPSPLGVFILRYRHGSITICPIQLCLNFNNTSHTIKGKRCTENCYLWQWVSMAKSKEGHLCMILISIWSAADTDMVLAQIRQLLPIYWKCCSENHAKMPIFIFYLRLCWKPPNKSVPLMTNRLNLKLVFPETARHNIRLHLFP